MDSMSVIITVFIVHAFMCIAVLVNAVDTPHKSMFKKTIYMLIALIIPIIGPIFINFLLGIKPVRANVTEIISPKLNDESREEIREWLDANVESSSSSLNGSSSSDSGYSGGDSGGGDSGGGGY